MTWRRRRRRRPFWLPLVLEAGRGREGKVASFFSLSYLGLCVGVCGCVCEEGVKISWEASELL
jgi:hypothetical protein